MARWTLTREVKRGDPVRLQVPGYSGTLRPERVGEAWVVGVDRWYDAAALLGRGWRLCPPPVATVPVATSAGQVVAEPTGTAETSLVAGWFAARAGAASPERLDLDRALALLRAPLPALPAPPEGEQSCPGAVVVVLTVTGWGQAEEEAVMGALAAADQAEAGSGVVLVQNGGAAAEEATRAWQPPALSRRLLRRRYVANDGFAAACEAGLAARRGGERWALFTQADAQWLPAALQRACWLAAVLEEAGAVAAVGPSGGYLTVPGDPSGIQEWGANAEVEHRGPPRAADFVAGYWLLAPLSCWPEGGWDDGYPLYYEDPDLCLRLALGGCRSVVWPDLGVSHRRGWTIRGLVEAGKLSQGDREAVRAWSRARFRARWESEAG